MEMTAITATPDYDGLMNYQREAVRLGQDKFLGWIQRIVIDPGRKGLAPDRMVTDRMGITLDFPRRPLAVSVAPDGRTLIVRDEIRNALGQIGLDDMPDPTWVPPVPTAAQCQDRDWRPPEPPRIHQSLAERSRGVVTAAGVRWLVIGPICQILVKPEGIAGGWLLQCAAAGDLHMELLLNQQTGEAFVVNGRYEILRYQ